MTAALAQWRAQGRAADISIDTRFDPRCGEIEVDPEQVKEALVNLLLNAREAMPAGGRITVTTRPAQAGQVELEIADTGCGIPPANLERIFEPFFTTKDYGTGLGLTNVKRLIQDNGGVLLVQSDPGHGSRFIIRLPTLNDRSVTAQHAEATLGN
jgi:signal transduction histidine kinase